MNDMILRAERLVRHSRRFYLRLCAFCDRPVGLATAPAAGARCEHARALLALARERLATLGRPQPDEDRDPDPDPPPRRAGRGRRRNPMRLTAAAA